LATATFLKGVPAIKVGWNLALTSSRKGTAELGLAIAGTRSSFA
jgi:hypothetical protein